MSDLNPGWLNRQFARVKQETDAWPESLRRLAGFTDEKGDDMTDKERIASLEAERDALKKQHMTLMQHVATAMDVLNSWARETGGVPEANHTWQLGGAIDRLWGVISMRQESDKRRASRAGALEALRGLPIGTNSAGDEADALYQSGWNKYRESVHAAIAALEAEHGQPTRPPFDPNSPQSAQFHYVPLAPDTRTQAEIDAWVEAEQGAPVE